MKYTELPLIDYIELLDEKVTVYLYAKDRRIIVLDDVRSNMSLDEWMVCVDHVLLGKRMTFMMPREDFSHVEYYMSQREHITKRDFDELHSFVEEQIYPPDLLTGPINDLTDDLI